MKRSVVALLAAIMITSVVVAAIITSRTIRSWEETFDVTKPKIQLF